ncbi:MAG: hypothetical protein KDK45_26165, partial [Leptospiraceae bacterium]|nr:hypothetical protein [Leptospiraceae bacterium]
HEVDTLFEIRLSNGEIIETTWNHPFYIENRGWTEAKDILAGNKLITSTGIIEVESNKEKYVSSVGVYNFEVENTHSYFVGENRVWVHNYDPKDFYLQDELKLPIKNQKLNPIEQPFNNIDEFIIDELKNQGKLLTEENKQKLLIKIALGNGNRNVDDFRNSLKEGTLDIFSSLINYYDRQIDTENNKRSAYISNEGRSLTFYEKKLLSLIYGKRLNTDVIKIKPSTEQSFFKREITNLYLKATNRKKEDVMYT